MIKDQNSNASVGSYVVGLARAAMEQQQEGSYTRTGDRVTFLKDVTFSLKGEQGRSRQTTVHAGTSFNLKALSQHPGALTTALPWRH